jgi:hypothetical protein
MSIIDDMVDGKVVGRVVESVLQDTEDTIISASEMVEFAYIDLYASLSLLHNQSRLDEVKKQSLSECLKDLEILKKKLDKVR